jgi:hypothetical protein
MRGRFAIFAKWLWANTDTLTKWLQVAALIFTAIWAYFRFQTSEAPGLKTPLAVSNNLKWTSRGEPSPGSCWIEAIIEVNNPGVTTYDVRKVQQRTWRKNLKVQSRELEFMNFPQIENESPIAEISPQSLIVRRYAPKTDIHDSFTWLHNDRPEPGLYIFRADVEDKQGRILGSAASWTDQLCR